MFKCEVVNIGGTYMDPLSIHTAMTISNLLRLFWSLCPHGHTSFSLSFFRYWFLLSLLVSMSTLGTLIFSDFNALHWHSSFSFYRYPLLVFFDPCSMWQMWYNKWHIVSALIFSAFHVLLGHSSLSFFRLSILTLVLSLHSWDFCPLFCFNVSTLPSVSLTP